MPDAGLDRAGVERAYRRIAPLYDLWAALTETRARARCLELAAVRDGEAVLEVAVGTGLAFAGLLRANPSGCTEGIDASAAMLARARARAAATGAGNYRLQRGDARALPFAAACFDVLLCNYLFDLLPERDFPAVLGEFRRVLKPGGRLVLANMTEGWRWHHGIWDLLYRLHPALLGGCRGVRLAGYLPAAGFREVQRSALSQCGFPSEVIAARAG